MSIRGGSTTGAAEAGGAPLHIFTKISGSPIKIDRRTLQLVQEVVKDKDGKPTKEKKIVIKSQEAFFNEALSAANEQWLTNYTNALFRMATSSDSSTRDVLKDPSMKQERDLLAVVGKYENGKLVGIDNQKVKDYLKEPENQRTVRLRQDREMMIKAYASGLATEYDAAGNRSHMANDEVVTLGIDQGVASRLYNERIAPWLNERYFQVAGRAKVFNIPGASLIGRLTGRTASEVNASISGSLTKGDAALAFGGLSSGIGLAALAHSGDVGVALAASAIPAVFKGVRSLFKDGLKMDYRQSVAAFQTIKSDPTMSKFVSEMYDIYVDDFIDTGGKLKTNPNRTLRSRNMEEVKLELFSDIITRQMYYTSIGVDPAVLDTMPGEFLTNSRTLDQPEQLRDPLQKEILDEFNPDNGGIRDTSGRNRIDALFDAGNLDVQGNLERFLEAQRKIIAREDQKFIERLGEHYIGFDADGKPIKGGIETLKAQIKEAETKKVEDLKKPHLDKKEAYEKDKTTIANEKAAFDQYSQNYNVLKGAKEAIKVQYGTDDIDSVIATITAKLNKIPSRKKSLITRRQNAIDKEWTTKYPGSPGASPPTNAVQAKQEYLSVVESLGAPFDAQLERLPLEEAQFKQEIESLRQKKLDIDNKRSALEEGQQSVVKVSKSIDALRNNFREISGWSIAGSVDLGVDALANEPIEELMRRINAANAADPTKGWKDSENNNSDKHAQLINAKLEAKAQLSEADARVANPALNTTYTDFLTVTSTWQITENQLRTYSLTELVNLIAAKRAVNPALAAIALPPLPTLVNQLVNSQFESQSRFSIRHSLYDVLVSDVEKGAQAAQQAADKVEVPSEKTDKELVVDLLEHRQQAVFKEAKKMTTEGARKKYFDTAVVSLARPNDPQNRGLSQEELKYRYRVPGTRSQVHPPRGYFEIIDMMWNMRDDKAHPDRDKYFLQVAKIMPPQKLARLMNENFPGHIPPALDTGDLAYTFTHINTMVELGLLDMADTYNMFKGIINTMKNDALANRLT